MITCDATCVCVRVRSCVFAYARVRVRISFPAWLPAYLPVFVYARMCVFEGLRKQGTFTQDQYQKSIYADAYTDVNYNNGKYQSFNINSRNTLTFNTGFVEESYGEVVEEILMSEKVAIYEDGQWVAVIPNRGSIDDQKSINDKTINYTMSFTYAFDQRMLVR